MVNDDRGSDLMERPGKQGVPVERAGRQLNLPAGEVARRAFYSVEEQSIVDYLLSLPAPALRGRAIIPDARPSDELDEGS